MAKNTYQYDVALSFAEEDIEVVECLVKELKRKGISYYYYKENEAESFGERLDYFLKDIYSKKARLCVIFFSKHYRRKRWTDFEMRAAMKRSVKSIRTYILPLKLDEIDIRELLGDVSYISVQQKSCESIVDIIYDKVQQAKRPVSVRRRLKHIFSKPKNLVGLALLLVGVVLYPDQLLPADVLARRLYDRSEVHRCAICNDDTISYSHGRGTCSGHQGVNHYVYDTIVHKKTMEQCEEEANEISWFKK